MGFTGGSVVKNPPVQELQETRVWPQGWEDPLEEDMATHSNTLAWRISQTEEPGGLEPIESQRVGHNWVTEHAHTYIKTYKNWGHAKKEWWNLNKFCSQLY